MTGQDGVETIERLHAADRHQASRFMPRCLATHDSRQTAVSQPTVFLFRATWSHVLAAAPHVIQPLHLM